MEDLFINADVVGVQTRDRHGLVPSEQRHRCVKGWTGPRKCLPHCQPVVDSSSTRPVDGGF